MPAGLVGYWSLDPDDINGTTALDGSGHYHDGTVHSSPTPTAGEIGGALDFAGGDYVTIDDDDLFDVSQITIAAWINVENNARKDLVSKNQGSSYDFETESGGRLRFNANFGSGIVSHRSPHGVYTAGVWQHVAVTYDESQVAFYVNGVLVGTNAQAGQIQSDTKDIKIANGQLLGAIDEVRIYDHALSQPEIAALALPGVPADFDGDNDVDGADFLSWQRGYSIAYTADDLTDWKENYLANTTSATPLLSAVAAAPFEFDTPASDVGAIAAFDLQPSPGDQSEVEAIAVSRFVESYLASPVSRFFNNGTYDKPRPLRQEYILEDIHEEQSEKSNPIDLVFERLGKAF